MVRNMVVERKKEPYYGDTFNCLEKEDKNFHWHKAYWWYVGMIVLENISDQIWLSRIFKVGCMLKVFYFLELVP